MEPTTVREALHRALDRARLSDDGRLPAERDLARDACVSRAEVRRWLEGLERSGTIVRYVGRGTFLNLALERDLSPVEIMTVRQLLEPQMVGFAVGRATSQQFIEFRKCLSAGAAASSFEEFEFWDSRLHSAIVASSGNLLLIKVYAVINEARDHPSWGAAKRRAFSNTKRKEYQLDHEALVAAIEARDPNLATQLIRDHLIRIERALLGQENEREVSSGTLNPDPPSK